MREVLRAVIPTEFQPPADLPRRLLAGLGYFRLRTWLAAHGEAIPEAGLYQPLYSPWLGEPAFEALYRAVHHLTLVSRDRCFVLWKTLQQAVRLPGHFVECGVYRGGTALLAARTLAGRVRDRELHLFDSFAGMPSTTSGVDRFRSGDLAGTSAKAVSELLAPHPFVRLHVGFIPDTFAGLSLDRVAWAHVDVDLYQSVRDATSFLYPRLVPGGFLLFDDYGFPSCAGARRAVDEAFAGRPELPLCLPTGQCLVVKLP